MHVRKLAAVIAAMTLTTWATAGAQDNPYGGGTRLTGPPPAEIPRGRISDEDKGRIVTQRLATCLIKANRGSVLKAIEVEPWQPGSREMLVRAVDSRCLESGTLAVPPNLLRGAFYQQFYQEKFGSGPPALTGTPMSISVADMSSLTEEQKAAIAMRQFGDCVVRRDLQDAHALVLATPGNLDELTAVKALMPHFSACVTQGSTWKLNRSSVSAILSEVLYRGGTAVPGSLSGN
jgi:hypothetical protein